MSVAVWTTGISKRGHEVFTVDGVKMTQGEYEKYCRANHTEDAYRTEKEACQLCYRLSRKYGRKVLVRGWGFDGMAWFDDQVDVARYLGLETQDLYVKALNLENAFRGAK